MKILCKQFSKNIFTFFPKKFSIKYKSFKLEENFINLYKARHVNFGFNGLGDLVYRRTYSRIKEDGNNEQWHETVRRVVEGTFNLLLAHYDESSMKVSNEMIDEMKKDAHKMYDKIFSFQFLPPGRGLWSMGTNITDSKRIYAALNNCAFVSTKPVDKTSIEEIIKPYLFLMDCAMLGVGVGFDTKGSSVGIKIETPDADNKKEIVVEDSREGWVDSLGVLLRNFLCVPDTHNEAKFYPVFNYDKIRKPGAPLKIFGGLSSGPKPLIELHNTLIEILDKNNSKTLNSRVIVDIMNVIGKSVVAGNIRRTAEIALGEPNDNEFIELKNYEKNPDRVNYGWLSNNSIYANIGMDYSKITESIKLNGEPGLLWLENMKKYSRMIDPPDYRDRLAGGGNPCLEQTLESYELCCLAETFPFHHNTKEEYLDTLKSAFLYAKIVTLGLTHWKETNSIMSRNRRIGVSMTGIMQFLNKFGIEELRSWSEDGYTFLKNYDRFLSNKLAVPESIKITSIKPSGTVSLLGGATPGIHFPHSRFYIRRVRLGANSNLVEELKRNGYHVEPDVMQPNDTVVVSFPIDLGEGVKTINDTNMWEQLSLAAFMQKYWADNQVSCTVSFDNETEGNQIKAALDVFQYQLKGISFLPILGGKHKNSSPYPQMPYEEVNKEKYNELMKGIKTKQISEKVKQSEVEKYDSNFCDSDSCNI